MALALPACVDHRPTPRSSELSPILAAYFAGAKSVVPDVRALPRSLFIDLVAGFGFGASAADHIAGDGGETDLVFGIEKIAGADESYALHSGQFMAFEEHDLHTIGQRYGFDLV